LRCRRGKRHGRRPPHHRGHRLDHPRRLEADAALPIEEVHVTEVTRSAARVKLLGSERKPVVGVEGEGQIIMRVQWQDEAATVLVASLAWY
jgi:hypothetical protein